MVLLVSDNHSAICGHLPRVKLLEAFVFTPLERPGAAPRMLGSCKLLISLKLRYSAPDLIRWTASYCFKVASPSVFYATQTESHFVDADTTAGVSKSEDIMQNTSEMNVSRRVHIFKNNLIKKY